MRRIAPWTIFLCLFAAAPSLAESPSQRWFRMLDPEGRVLGRVHETVGADGDGREYVTEQEMRFKVSGHTPTHVLNRITRREDVSGRTLSVRFDDLSDHDRASVEATFDNGVASITRANRHGSRLSRVPLPDGIVFDNGEALIRNWKDDQPLAFHRFDPVGMAVERVILERADGGKIIRKAYDGDDLRSVSQFALDAEGRSQGMRLSMLGLMVLVEPSETEIRSSELSAGRSVPHQMVPSPYRIPAPAKVGHIRYRFGFRGGLRVSMPETGEQRVKPDGDGLIVDVCLRCGPGLSTDARALERWRQPAEWLESASSELAGAARDIAGKAIGDREKMRLLAKATRKRLAKFDYEGHYSALDAWRRKAGDCTEDAALLATLGRAAGIPTRVANGLVYSREYYHGMTNSFVPHSWVLAYVDGAWESFDPALDEFDATHLAITVGDGDARSVAAANELITLLDWRGMAEVRSRPAP